LSQIIDEIQKLSNQLHEECNPEVISNLRLLRRNAANVWLDASEDILSELLGGEFGQAHHTLCKSGLTGLPMSEEEKEFIRPLLKTINHSWPSHATTKHMLACMLYLEPYEISLKHDFFKVPDWFLDSYISFLLSPPKIFKNPMENELYFTYIESLMAYMQEVITGPHALSLGNLPEVFLSRLNIMQAYFTENNLSKLMQLRYDLAEFVSYGKGNKLDMVFPPHQKKQDDLIHVGFLIATMTDHTESFFALAHIDGLPRAQMHISLYTLHNTGHPVENHAKSITDKFVGLEGIPVSEQVDLIRKDHLDILVFATNVAAVSNEMFYLSLYRLAPLQVANMASPITTGIRNMDLFLSSEDNEPKKEPQSHYSEKLIQIPGALNYFSYQCYPSTASINVSRSTLGLSDDTVIFFSGSNFFKIIPELSKAWVNILARSPNSVLILMPFNPNWSNQYPQSIFIDRLFREFATAGIEQHRLIVINPVPARADVLEVIKIADVYLDAFPFGGSCSSFDPLSIACPAVVRGGKTARSRHGATVLRMFGLDDLVTNNDQEYIDLAVRLATDSEARKNIQDRINRCLQVGNPMLNVQHLGNRVGAALTSVVQDFQNNETRLYSMDTASLTSEINSLAKKITPSKPFSIGLTDTALLKMLIIPYFQTLKNDTTRPHLVDVGACYGEIAKPFLDIGWTADLFEPDPDCMEHIKSCLNPHMESIRLHAMAVGPIEQKHVTFFKAQCDGLSGLSKSPYGETRNQLEVPSVRLDKYLASLDVNHVDMLKIDTEGWDLEVLMTHDFEHLPPKLIFIEVNTAFEKQSLKQIQQAIRWMSKYGYTALTFRFQDDGNFKKGVWTARLAALTQGSLKHTKNEEMMANILFYRNDDKIFMATLVKLLRMLFPD